MTLRPSSVSGGEHLERLRWGSQLVERGWWVLGEGGGGREGEWGRRAREGVGLERTWRVKWLLGEEGRAGEGWKGDGEWSECWGGRGSGQILQPWEILHSREHELQWLDHKGQNQRETCAECPWPKSLSAHPPRNPVLPGLSGMRTHSHPTQGAGEEMGRRD